MLGKDLKIPLNFKWNLKEVTIEESFDEEISENFFISDYIFSFHTVETLYAWDNFKKYNHHEVFLKDLKELVRRSFEIDEKFAFLSRQFRWVYNRLKEFKKLWDGIKEYRCRTERCSLFLEFMDDDNEREYPGEVPNLNEIRRHEPELYYRLIPLRDALYKLEDKEIYKILGEDPNRWGYYHNSKSWISFPQKLISMKKDLKKIAEKFSDSFDKFIEAQKDFFKDGIISLLKNVNPTTYNNVKDNFNRIQDILNNNYFSPACMKPEEVACVAVLVNRKGAFFALNGIDIASSSSTTNNCLIPNQGLINLGRQLENYSNIKYVQLSLQTLRYVNLNADRTCDFTTPMQPIPLSSDLNTNSVNPKNYTCCERKLSSYFKRNNKIYVSFLPCKKCLPALECTLSQRVISYAITKKPGFYQQKKVEVKLVVKKDAAEGFKLTEKYCIL